MRGFLEPRCILTLRYTDFAMTAFVPIRVAENSGISPEQKETSLLARLSEAGSLIVALSGGADSAYLAWAAQRAIGEHALSVTALSPSFSAHDRSAVDQFIREFQIHHEFIETHEVENPAYRANAADTLDFRPGHRAATEHRVLAPLLDVGLRKSEIRQLSRRAGLPTWDRPASACLASRVPYGTEVTPERLTMIERGEAALRELGFRQFRVRLHDKLARVEIAPEEMDRAFSRETSAAISQALKRAGFTYVALDLEGYRQGSLNEALPQPKRT